LFVLRVKQWQLEGASLQPFLVQQEPIAIPLEHFHLLTVLGEKDEHCAAEGRELHFGSYNLIQAVYAHVHAHISLTYVILGTLI